MFSVPISTIMHPCLPKATITITMAVMLVTTELYAAVLYFEVCHIDGTKYILIRKLKPYSFIVMQQNLSGSCFVPGFLNKN